MYQDIANTETALRASLPQSVACVIRRDEQTTYLEDSDPLTTYHYYPIGPLPEEARAGLEAAFAMFDEACRPAESEDLERWLARLYSATIPRNSAQEDLELKIALYSEELAGFPGEIVQAVLREASVQCRWFPPLADLVKEISRLSQRRCAMRACLWQMLETAGRPKLGYAHSGGEGMDLLKALANAIDGVRT